MAAPRFEIRKAQGGGFYWRLIAANGEVLCHSEIYRTITGARKGTRAARIAVRGASAKALEIP